MKSKIALLHRLLNIYSVSTADCKRGFRVMNLQQTNFRNSLAMETVSNLLMISIIGPDLEFWQPRPYVVRWLQNENRGALNKPTGPPKQKTKLASSTQFFFTTALPLPAKPSDKCFVPEDNGGNDDLKSESQTKPTDKFSSGARRKRKK